MILTKSEVEELLFDYFDIHIKLRDMHFHKFENETGIFITFSQNNISTLDQSYSAGIIFAELRVHDILLFPSICTIIEDLRDFNISGQDIQEFTRGQEITVQSSLNGLFRIIDANGLLLGLGKLRSHRLLPITDIGIYLREEDN